VFGEIREEWSRLEFKRNRTRYLRVREWLYQTAVKEEYQIEQFITTVASRRDAPNS
jgi:hypothetical protein